VARSGMIEMRGRGASTQVRLRKELAQADGAPDTDGADLLPF
jgi:hypothetical protein